MTMASSAQGGVFGPTSWIVMHGGARPIIDGVAQANMRRLPQEHDLAFSRPLRDRGDAREAAQRMIISPLQSVLTSASSVM